MNPFNIPFTGASWIEIVLALGGAAVVLIYVFQLFLSRIQRMFNTTPDPDLRAAELLDQYKRQRAGEMKWLEEAKKRDEASC